MSLIILCFDILLHLLANPFADINIEMGNMVTVNLYHHLEFYQFILQMGSMKNPSGTMLLIITKSGQHIALLGQSLNGITQYRRDLLLIAICGTKAV